MNGFNRAGEPAKIENRYDRRLLEGIRFSSLARLLGRACFCLWKNLLLLSMEKLLPLSAFYGHLEAGVYCRAEGGDGRTPSSPSPP